VKRETISVVLDPDFGQKLFELARRSHIWITPSSANRAAVEAYWAGKSENSNSVTIWSAPHQGATEDEWLGILDDLELHHGGQGGGAGIEQIEVFGAEVSVAVEAALREFGYGPAERTPGGFRAERSIAG
jgi:hypothetical protein